LLAHRARVGRTMPPLATSSGHRAALRGDGAGSSWRRSVNCVATQGRGRRQRPIDVAVDGHVWKLERRLGRKGETGCSGRKGESSKLGSGVFQRVLVTTSRLQRLVRGILSWDDGGASVSSEERG
jgi:hypothetical protein